MPKPTADQSLEALNALREPNRRKLYRYVVRRPQPVGRDEAADALRISRSMAAFHLDRLADLGLLHAEYRRLSGRTGRGAGRPAKIYSRSRRSIAVSLPARNHELLARLLAMRAASGDDDTTEARPAARFGRSLGARARSGSPDRGHEHRVDCLVDVLERLGFEPVRAGSYDVWNRNCPFDPLSRIHPSVVCQTALAMVGGAAEGVGCEGVRITREAHPDRCCVVIGPS